MNSDSLNNQLIDVFFDQNKDFCCAINSNGEVIKVNQKWTRILGKKTPPVKFADYLPEVEKKQWLIHWQNFLSHKNEELNITNCIKTNSKEYISINWKLLKYGNYIFLIGKEQTENDSYIKKLSASLESTSDAVYWGNALGKFEYVNDQACQMLGYTKEEFRNLTIFDIDKSIKVDDLGYKFFDSIDKKQNHNYYTETLHQKKNGDSVPVEVNATRIWINSQWSVLCFARDISERKQREQDLLRSQKLLKESQRIAKIGCWEQNLQDKTLEWSDEVYAIVGYERGELDDNFNNLEKIIPGDDAVKVREIIEKIIRDKRFYDHEHRVIKKNGEIIHVYVAGDVVLNNEGEVIRIFGVVQDITERKKHEEELLKKQRLLTNSYRLAKMGAWELDLATLKSVWNKEYYDIMGLDSTKDEASLETFNHYVHPEDRARVKLHLKETLETKKYADLEYRCIIPDGSIKNIIITGDIVLDEKDIPIRLYGIAQDITERRRYEKALKESENKMQRIFDFTPAGLGIVKDRITTKINSHICQISGYSEEDIINASTQIFYSDEKEYNRVGKKLYQEMSEKGIGNVEAVWKRKDGKLINVLIRIALIDPDDSSKGAISSTLDITEQKRQQQQLVELNATKDKFFRIIGHDLRNPFGSIMGLSEIIIEQFTDFSEQNILEMITQIHKSSKMAYNLSENLLTWARSQSGDIEFKPIRIHVANLINSTIDLLLGHARQKNIELKTNIEEGIHVFADENMLSTIIRNLTSNAIKFTREHGIVIISALAKDNKTVFSVSDTGVGIEKENIDKLFRIDEEHTTLGTNKEKGSGLGLILCKEFVDKHGGILWVASTLGKGSTFSFSIPLKEN